MTWHEVGRVVWNLFKLVIYAWMAWYLFRFCQIVGLFGL